MAILGLICEGHSTKQIAHRLGISFKTVACHRANLMQKSGARNVVQLFRWAIEEGYVAVEDTGGNGRLNYPPPCVIAPDSATHK